MKANRAYVHCPYDCHPLFWLSPTCFRPIVPRGADIRHLLLSKHQSQKKRENQEGESMGSGMCFNDLCLIMMGLVRNTGPIELPHSVGTQISAEIDYFTGMQKSKRYNL